MKNKLLFLALSAFLLILLGSCILIVDDQDPDKPDTKYITVSNEFKGPVKNMEEEITSYQYMAYVKNNTSKAMENLKVEIVWEDYLGNEIYSKTVTIHRLNSGMKWPIADCHDSVAEVNRLKNLYNTVTVKYLSSSESTSEYVLNTNVIDKEITHHATAPTHITGHLKNPNDFDIMVLTVIAISEDNHGRIVEYGEEAIYSVLDPDHIKAFSMTLNEPAGTPKQGTTRFYVTGRKY